MFFQTQKPELKKEYEHFLKIAGCLSNLFSESDIPYLYYRVAEKVFCRAFSAEDLSRSDVSADAKKDALGIGLKTFLANNNKTFQKVAEFYNDRKHDYSFLVSKSTLTKRFITEPIVYEFNVDILEDPLLELRELLEKTDLHFEKESKIKQTIYLPLYGRNQIVFEKSGLNQWNAGGRDRHANEVYIPIPAEIHKNFPSFFPDRETPFDLKLPNGNTMQSKVCQDGGKALMSYSNRELGQWILRDVLKLKEEELLTYDRLQILGIDSVRIDKIDNV